MTSIDDRFEIAVQNPEQLDRRELFERIGNLFVTAPLVAALSAMPDEAQAQRPRSGVKRPSRVERKYPLNTSHELPADRTRTRSSTEYIILHTTEGEFPGSLAKIRRFANAHYLLDRDGTVYSIVPLNRWANHAGRSMWEGKENLSDRSIGIEIVGYHYGKITDRQYDSLKPLVGELQQRYGRKDEHVLGHFQIAYAVNQWTQGKKARGRKKDGINIDWQKIGVDHRTDDPDVKAGRVIPDQFLQGILAREEDRRGIFGIGGESPDKRVAEILGPNIIEGPRTAWSIAGDEYNQPSTFYVAPNNQITPGNQIRDWSALQRGTRVYTNTDLAAVIRATRPIITLARGETVWSHIQAAYNDSTTCYVLPGTTKVIKGNKADFDDVVPGTRIVLDCTGPFEIKRDRGPIRYAGRGYNTDNAVYIFPNGDMKTGSQIQNFNVLPKETQMLVRRK